MSSAARSRVWLVAVAVAVVSAALAGGAAWLSQRNTIERLKTEADARLKTLDDLNSRIHSLEAQLSAKETSSTTSEEPSSTPAAKPTSTTKQFTFIRQVTMSSGTVRIVADYAQMLTGAAAAAAATAHGDESPPPNDYYIVNDNKKLRTLKVDSDASVKVTTNSDGTVDPPGHAMTLSQFVDIFNSTPQIREAPFNITLTGGMVTAIEEQYLP